MGNKKQYEVLRAIFQLKCKEEQLLIANPHHFIVNLKGGLLMTLPQVLGDEKCDSQHTKDSLTRASHIVNWSGNNPYKSS